MSDTTDKIVDTVTDAVVTAAATEAVNSLTDLQAKKEAKIAELQAQIASTSSTWVKIRNAAVIALINSAAALGESYLAQLLSKL